MSLLFKSPVAQAAQKIQQAAEISSHVNQEAIESIYNDGLDEYLEQGIDNFQDNIEYIANQSAQAIGEAASFGISEVSSLLGSFLGPIFKNNFLSIALIVGIAILILYLFFKIF